jgi:LPXTG-motif cell wall-anchored protein
MGTMDTKLYVAVGILAVLGGGIYFAKKKEKAEEERYTLVGQEAALPKITISEDDTKGIDKVTLVKAGEDGGAGTDIELAKQGEDWKVTKPHEATANQPNVKSMLDNLKTLKLVEMIDSGKTSYSKFKVGDNQGLHAVFKKGDKVVLDAWFGENGGRGQMTRIAGKDGVYAVKGYSSYLYERDLKGWRDTTVFKFEDTAATAVSVENEHGSLAFTKEGDKWKGKFKGKDIERYDDTKVGDLLRAYKALNADGFADKAKSASDLGLDKPSATLVITLNDGAKREVKVGSTAEGTSRWVQATGIQEFVSISSWAAEWATSDVKKFQKPEEPKDGGAPAATDAGAKPASSAKPKPAGSAKPAAPAAPAAAPAPAPKPSG